MEEFKALGARLSNWGRWGATDQRGTLNLIAPQHVVAAAGLVRRGAVFDLGLSFGTCGVAPSGGHRPPPIHLLSTMPGDWSLLDGSGFVEDFIALPTHTGTHWDGLAHCFY